MFGEVVSCSRLRTFVLPSSLSPWLRAEQGEDTALLYSLMSEQGQKQVPGSMVITYADDSMSTCGRGRPQHDAVAGVCLSIFVPVPSELWLGSQTLLWLWRQLGNFVFSLTWPEPPGHPGWGPRACLRSCWSRESGLSFLFEQSQLCKDMHFISAGDDPKPSSLLFTYLSFEMYSSTTPAPFYP